MKPSLCQSCGKPVTIENMGTKRDGEKNREYCNSCYQNGEFTDPHLTIRELELKLIDMAKVHNEISLEEAQQVIRSLPDLKRWQMSNM